ncbi:hypothetical protein ABT263_29410 [Kitasatospora sp. NPDC001603]|uniref:hypothetical protein n=1 Tax=Kitasatospora sp. NPDC001603 TaxID=3154388 RepID=UPI00331E9821
MTTIDAHTRHENALAALAQAQDAYTAELNRRPARTGDSVQDAPPVLLWAAEMTRHGDKVADAMIEVAEAKVAARIAAPDWAATIRERAEAYRAQTHNAFSSGLSAIRQAVLDHDSQGGPVR